jgi:hypothetical protein
MLLLLLLLLFEGDLEAGILFQPSGKFPVGARQPRLTVLATGEREHSQYLLAYSARLIIGVR